MSSKKILVMGNEAIALGAIRAGVRMAAGYPGTPSTEILETIAKHNDGHIHVEWSVNEKAAMEVGAGRGICRREDAGYHEAGRTECGLRSSDEPCLYGN